MNIHLEINQANGLSGDLVFPGDKSITHRSLIIASIAKGKSIISNASMAADCMSTLKCLKMLGADIEKNDEQKNRQYTVIGRGLNGLNKPLDILDVGNSGTTIRLLSGLLAGQSFNSTLTGDESIQKRPMDRIIKPLIKMGASISGKDNDRYAPLEIIGSKLKGCSIDTGVASAQVKSCILLAGLYSDGETKVAEPQKSRDHTERILKAAGASIKILDNSIVINSGELDSFNIIIPGDISTAFFFITAGLIIKNSKITVREICLNPTRTGAIEKLKEMGANLIINPKGEILGEPFGDISVKSSELKGVEISGDIIPLLIDEIPALVVAATQASGRTVIKDAAELKIKESNRITAMATELSKMGAKIRETDDGMVIDGPTKLQGTVVESYGDHRIAMSLAIAGLIADGKTVIKNAECIDISHPSFTSDLHKVSP